MTPSIRKRIYHFGILTCALVVTAAAAGSVWLMTQTIADAMEVLGRVRELALVDAGGTIALGGDGVLLRVDRRACRVRPKRSGVDLATDISHRDAGPYGPPHDAAKIGRDWAPVSPAWLLDRVQPAPQGGQARTDQNFVDPGNPTIATSMIGGSSVRPVKEGHSIGSGGTSGKNIIVQTQSQIVVVSVLPKADLTRVERRMGEEWFTAMGSGLSEQPDVLVNAARTNARALRDFDY
jgi:hypothetical protein